MKASQKNRKGGRALRCLPVLCRKRHISVNIRPNAKQVCDLRPPLPNTAKHMLPCKIRPLVRRGRRAEVKKREAMYRRCKIPRETRNRRKKRQEPFLGRVEVDDCSSNRTDEEEEEPKGGTAAVSPRPSLFPSLLYLSLTEKSPSKNNQKIKAFRRKPLS